MRKCARPANARERKDWSWKKWARRVDEYLKHMNAYLWPDLHHRGRGQQKADKFLPLLTETEVVAAQMENEAGIVAAWQRVSARRHAKQTEQDTAQDMPEDDTSN